MNKDSDGKNCELWGKVTIPPRNGLYAITLTFQPKVIQGCDDPIEQLVKTMPIIVRFFKPIGRIYLQAELQKNGNIHYHGFLDMHDRIKYSRTFKGWMDRIGNIVLKTLSDNKNHWISYCMEEHEMMHEILGEVYDDESMFWKGWITYDSWRKYHKSYKVAHHQKLLLNDYIDTGEDVPYHDITTDPYFAGVSNINPVGP